MKVLRRLKGYVIVELSLRDKEYYNSNCPYACVLKDEMEYPPDLRVLDMECETFQEAIDFVGG